MRPCDFFSNKLVIDSWNSIFESVNHFSNHSDKSLSGSVISTNQSECVAKFRFASVSRVWKNDQRKAFQAEYFFIYDSTISFAFCCKFPTLQLQNIAESCNEKFTLEMKAMRGWPSLKIFLILNVGGNNKFIGFRCVIWQSKILNLVVMSFFWHSFW